MELERRHAARLVAHGALVFLAGMLGGFPFAFVLLGKIALWPVPGSIDWTPPGDPRAWRMLHLEGVLNGLTLIGVAAAGRFLDLSDREQRWLVWSLLVMAWGNLVASLVGPIWGGRGLEFGGSLSNSLMYLLFVAAIFGVLIALWLVWRGAARVVRRA
jgi:hypothetical protein